MQLLLRMKWTQKAQASDGKEDDDAEDYIFSYLLDELKALQRKIDSTFAD